MHTERASRSWAYISCPHFSGRRVRGRISLTMRKTHSVSASVSRSMVSFNAWRLGWMGKISGVAKQERIQRNNQGDAQPIGGLQAGHFLPGFQIAEIGTGKICQFGKRFCGIATELSILMYVLSKVWEVLVFLIIWQRLIPAFQ